MKWVTGSLLALAVAAVLASGVVAASSGTPHACHLLTKGLVEDYFNTDMTLQSNVPKSCDWQSRIAKTHKGAILGLTTFARLENAKTVIAYACHQRKGLKQLTIPGADKACGAQAFTGLCLTPPKGEDPKDWCLWDVKISFRVGATVGSLELASLKIYSLNNLKNGAALAKKLLKRW